jgi:hypothetical protein
MSSRISVRPAFPGHSHLTRRLGQVCNVPIEACPPTFPARLPPMYVRISIRFSLDLQTTPPDDPSPPPIKLVSRPRIWFSESAASYQPGGLPLVCRYCEYRYRAWPTQWMGNDLRSARRPFGRIRLSIRPDIRFDSVSFLHSCLHPSWASSPRLTCLGNTERRRSFSRSACAVIVRFILNMTASSIPGSALDDSSTHRAHPCRGTANSVVDPFLSRFAPLCVRIFNGVRGPQSMDKGMALAAYLLQRDPVLRSFWVPRGADFHDIISRNLDLLQTSGWMKSKVTRSLAFAYG